MQCPVFVRARIVLHFLNVEAFRNERIHPDNAVTARRESTIVSDIRTSPYSNAVLIGLVGLLVAVTGGLFLAPDWQMSAVLGGCALVLTAFVTAGVEAVLSPVAPRRH